MRSPNHVTEVFVFVFSFQLAMRVLSFVVRYVTRTHGLCKDYFQLSQQWVFPAGDRRRFAQGEETSGVKFHFTNWILMFLLKR